MGKGIHDHQAIDFLQFAFQPLGFYQVGPYIGQHLRIMLHQEFAGFDSQGVDGPWLSEVAQTVDDDG